MQPYYYPNSKRKLHDTDTIGTQFEGLQGTTASVIPVRCYVKLNKKRVRLDIAIG